jgi:hypothetical protein
LIYRLDDEFELFLLPTLHTGMRFGHDPVTFSTPNGLGISNTEASRWESFDPPRIHSRQRSS